MRVRLFIDFWNLTLNWNQRAPGKLDWTKVSRTLCAAANRSLAVAGLPPLTLEETRVYASYEPGRDPKLRSWLQSFLDRLPGVRVFSVERHWRVHPVHCRNCGQDIVLCPNCSAPLGRASEKEIDSQIVSDLLSLAWEGAYDVALLVSSDRDFIPAVELLQTKNLKVINATWQGQGHELARICWASFEMDHEIQNLLRPST